MTLKCVFLALMVTCFVCSAYSAEYVDEAYVPVPKVYYSQAMEVKSSIFYGLEDSLPRDNWKREWVLVFFPVYDNNGAFADDPQMLVELLARKYNVLFSRITHISEATTYVHELEKMHSARGEVLNVKHLVLGAHGSPHSLTFSEYGVMTLFDKKQRFLFKTLSPWLFDRASRESYTEGHKPSLEFLTTTYEFMQKGSSKIVLLSCSVGKGRGSIAETMADYLPMITVMGANAPVPANSVYVEDLDRLTIYSDYAEFRSFYKAS